MPRFNKNFLTLWIRLKGGIRGERRPKDKVTSRDNSNIYLKTLARFGAMNCEGCTMFYGSFVVL